MIEREQHHLDLYPKPYLYNTRMTADTCGPMEEVVKAKLRKAWETRAPQSADTRARRAASISAARNTSGQRGVSLIRGKVWRACCGSKHVGHYSTFEEAVAAREKYLENPGAHKPARTRHPSGHKGVIWNQLRKGWVAIDLRHKYIGIYATPEIAASERAQYLADPANYVRPVEPPPSGHVGVSWDKANSKWLAYAPRRKYLGRFKTIEAAVAARDAYLSALSCNIAPNAPEPAR
ncbi:HNH endonuclease [Xanthomonas phage NEB7]|nr:HNH endonuclease [Xanthomonas phage NEB7]